MFIVCFGVGDFTISVFTKSSFGYNSGHNQNILGTQHIIIAKFVLSYQEIGGNFDKDLVFHCK
jgi:hypothetical protein